MGKNNYITIAESPNSLGHPTPFPQFYLPSSPQSHAHRRGLGRLCSGRKGQGRDRALPVRSEGTRYFLLSRSGTLALGAFSTITGTSLLVTKYLEAVLHTNKHASDTSWVSCNSTQFYTIYPEIA